MQNIDNEEVDMELKVFSQAVRYILYSLGVFNTIIYDTKDSVNFSYANWRIIEDVKKIKKILNKQKSKNAKEFRIIESKYWQCSFTKK